VPTVLCEVSYAARSFVTTV